MPGVQVFTRANYGKETVKGTPVAPTRQLYVDGTGVLKFDNGLNFHEGENSGLRTRIRRATQAKEDVALKLSADAVSYDDLTLILAWLKGGLTGTGAGADKTWTLGLSQTGANSPEAFSFDVGDDVQNWRCQYVQPTSIKLSSALGEMTKLEVEAFAQRAVKTTAAAPALNSSVKIPGDTWTLKFATSIAGLTAASVQTNFLIDWALTILPGYRWRHYMDGNLYGAQSVETDVSAKLEMTVESTALAVSEIYDKMTAQTMDFVRLKNTGPSLGASNYSAQIDLPILWEEPEPIGAEDDGVNLWKVSANLAYDSVSANSLAAVVVNSIAAIP